MSPAFPGGFFTTEPPSVSLLIFPFGCGIVKMTTLPQGNQQIQCNPYQNANGIFHRIRTNIFKFVWKHTRPWILKTILRNRNGTGGIMLPHFQSVGVSRSEADSVLQQCVHRQSLQISRRQGTVVLLLSCVQCFVTAWTAADQASLSFTISQSSLKLMSMESVMPSNQWMMPISSVVPFPIPLYEYTCSSFI